MTLWLALLSGMAVALACGLVGSFLVLRGEVFSGDALSHVAFTGALAALAFGWDLRLGLYGACIGVGLVLAVLANAHARGRVLLARDDTTIGIVFAWVLGLGALFLSLFATSRSAGDGISGHAGVSVLFGSILGQSTGQAWASTVGALVVALLVTAIARPLLFVSVDGAVAKAKGVPVTAVTFAFFILLGIVAALATQAVGALLLLGLVAAPAGAARVLTPRPYWGMALASLIAMASVAVGLGVAELVPTVPPSFGIVVTAASVYAVAGLVRHRGRRLLGSLS